MLKYSIVESSKAAQTAANDSRKGTERSRNLLMAPLVRFLCRAACLVPQWSTLRLLEWLGFSTTNDINQKSFTLWFPVRNHAEAKSDKVSAWGHALLACHQLGVAVPTPERLPRPLRALDAPTEESPGGWRIGWTEQAHSGRLSWDGTGVTGNRDFLRNGIQVGQEFKVSVLFVWGWWCGFCMFLWQQLAGRVFEPLTASHPTSNQLAYHGLPRSQIDR